MTGTTTGGRTRVAVGGAGEVLAAALAAGSPRAAAHRLRDLAPALDLAEAREASRRDGAGVVVAVAGDAVLAVRWFAPATPTTIHDHGSWGAALVVDGADRYERFTLRDGGAVLDTTFWLDPAEVVWWPGPPDDVHRQQAGDGGATELVLVAGARTRHERRDLVEVDGLGAAGPLADAVLAAYRERRFAPLRGHYRADVLGDVNVPSWRFQVTGRAALGELFDREELGVDGQRLRSFRAIPTGDGCVVEVEIGAGRGDGAVRWREVHVLRTRDGRVAEHVTYCTGRWDVATVAAQAAGAPMVRP